MPDNIQPGQTIPPNDSSVGGDGAAPAGFTPAPNPFEGQPAAPEPATPPPAEPAPVVQAPSAPVAAAPAATEPQPAPEPEAPAPPPEVPATQASQPAGQDGQNLPLEEEENLIGWQAPEFVQTQKPVGWYVLMVGFFVVLSILAVITQQYLAIGLFALVGLALAIYANRKPRVLGYGITTLGVQIGKKSYSFDNFSGFSQSNDYGQVVFDLAPTKRFGTLVSMPAPKEMIDEIDDTLGDFLPKTESHEDWIDKLFKYLRF